MIAPVGHMSAACLTLSCRFRPGLFLQDVQVSVAAHFEDLGAHLHARARRGAHVEIDDDSHWSIISCIVSRSRLCRTIAVGDCVVCVGVAAFGHRAGVEPAAGHVVDPELSLAFTG